MTNEEGLEYYNETMPMPRQTTHRELLEEAMKALDAIKNFPSGIQSASENERYVGQYEADTSKSLGKAYFAMQSIARNTYDKLKAALEQKP